MASTGNSESVPYLGSKISIISKCEIRYEGILYTVDTKQATIALAKVKCLGTESRLTDKPVGPREEIYEYIIFKAVDIKDLTVCETPQPVLQLHGLPFDPAILEASQKSRSENVDPNKQPSVKQHAQQNHLNNSYGNSGNHSEMLSSLSHQQSMQHEQRQSIVASTMHNGVIDYRQLPLSTSTTITSVAATTETGVQANVNIPPILRNQTRLQPVVTKEVQQRSQYGTTYHAHIEAAMPPRRPLISDHEKYIAGSASEPSRPTSRERPHVSFSLDDDASRNEAQKRLNRSSDNALMTMGRSPQLYNRGSVNFQGRGRGVANGYNRGFVRSTSVPLNNTFNAPSDNYQRRFGTTVPTSGPSYNHNGVNHNGINGNNNSKKDTPVNFGNDSFPHPYQGFFPPPPPPAAMANFFNRSFDFGMLGRPTNPLMATAAQQYRGGFIPPGPGAMRGARGGMRYFVPRGTAHVQPRYRKALLDNSWSRDGKPTTTAKEPELKFDTDFDFEEANAKFVAEIKDTETKFAEGEKLDEASEIKPERSESTEAEKENPTDKENEASAPSQDEQANGHRSPIHVGPLGAIENKDVSCTEKPKKFYDRETSFFDNISCEFENRVDERKPLAVTRQRTRDLNKETFGTEFATRFNGPPRGRGMGPRNVNGRYFQPNRFNPRGYGSVQEYRHANVYRGRWMGRPAYPLVR